MKKSISCILAGALAAMMLAGCGSAAPETAPASETTAEAATSETTAAESAAETTTAEETTAAKESSAKETEAADNADKESAADDTDEAKVRVGSLKGPTSMGLVFLMQMAEEGTAANSYDFTMVTAADELLPKVVSGDVDIALVPANVASVLYNKTQGQISVIDINTLGVVYVAASDDSIKTMADLKGRTIYMTGKGTTPDYVFRYLLDANGLTDADVTLEYKSEPTEVAALLKEQPDAIGVLPQPFVTAACAQNENLKIVLDLTKEWENVQTEGGSQMVTGVTVVRNAFLEENPDAVDTFLEEHAKSAALVNEQLDEAAELVAKTGIIEKAPIAKKALPYCNITCITGSEMKDALSGYLQVLFEQDPKAVGGKLPADEFYYVK
ncbi:MAG: ABC transporter substrate-binding protein [Lachnospiraceae bacterium]|nr:ABC transporter substrate-binding protein [Lachnospiraceae bacterium]